MGFHGQVWQINYFSSAIYKLDLTKCIEIKINFRYRSDIFINYNAAAKVGPTNHRTKDPYEYSAKTGGSGWVVGDGTIYRLKNSGFCLFYFFFFFFVRRLNFWFDVRWTKTEEMKSSESAAKCRKRSRNAACNNCSNAFRKLHSRFVKWKLL